jgi:hypothetical protein
MAPPLEPLTIQLSAAAARRLRRVAEIAGRPVDEIAAETLSAGLPPLLEDVPGRFQAELSPLEKLSSDALWTHLRAALSVEQTARYEALKALAAERQLSQPEAEEWEKLREEADRLMFRKAYAALLLKWRGERIPNLAELELTA